jgi:WD40 repeat protein
VRIWNADNGDPVGVPFTGHTSYVDTVAFSPDGHRLASGSNDNTVRLWDADTGQPLTAAFTGHTAGATSVAFAPDGQRLASGSLDGTVRFWPTSATPQTLCDKLNANMSHRQWRDWVSPDVSYETMCPGLPIAPD